jgi:hypothetical protein
METVQELRSPTTIIKYNRGVILMPQNEWPQSKKKIKLSDPK